MSSSSTANVQGLQPTAARADKGQAILTVLTQASLFRHITSFMPGWPHFVLEFERAMKQKYPSRALWSSPGCMLHVAVSESNERVLQALCELVMVPKYRNLVKLQPNSVDKCFTCKRNTRMLALLKTWSAKS